MSILVTGGTGYIGSHTCVELLNKGEDIIVLDNLSNSKIEIVDRIKQITGKDFKFYKADLLNKQDIEKIFEENKIESVMHFAGLKAVGESVAEPIRYYINNVTGSLVLLDTMKKYNVKKIIFSSSATVYGSSNKIPYTENMPLSSTNPYGTTKLFTEQILQDIYKADNNWSVVILRYFNPIGAHSSGLIGEDPQGIPNNLMPFVSKVACKKLKQLSVFGNDYNTHDGTGVRDYIHVVDLAVGHLKSLKKLSENKVHIYNLGTGTGYSVLDIVKTFEEVNNIKVDYTITDRRPGDIGISYADPTKAQDELGWISSLGLEDMCKDTWNFQTKNLESYKYEL